MISQNDDIHLGHPIKGDAWLLIHEIMILRFRGLSMEHNESSRNEKSRCAWELGPRSHPIDIWKQCHKERKKILSSNGRLRLFKEMIPTIRFKENMTIDLDGLFRDFEHRDI
jgi:hypothetical protein